MNATTTCIHDLDPTACSVCNGVDLLQGVVTQRGRTSMTEDLADAVFPHIPDDGDDWISREDLAAASDLTPEQVSRAIAYLRDTEPDLPLVSSRYGYRFSTDGTDVGDYRAARARTAHTQIRRTWTGVVKPYIEHTTSPETVRWMTLQFEQILASIEHLIQ